MASASKRKIAKIRVALTIAGSDPSGGAGLQADLKTFAACGVYGFSVLTAVIAQNSGQVARVEPVAAALLTAQLETLLDERRPEALKTGALATAANVCAVADAIERWNLPAPIVDPVLLASSGAHLLDPAGVTALRDRLLPLARVVTPNLPEAESLSGLVIDSRPALVAAARAIVELGTRAVVIKGGHSMRAATGPGAPRAETGAIDLLFDGRQVVEFAAPRIANGGAHGTGCAFSAALTAYLARGLDLEAAVRRAKGFVTRALRQRLTLGRGRPVLDHFAG
jgi:hydroxymethylpyrimidine/phosphomethylpyrimidine kinase